MCEEALNDGKIIVTKTHVSERRCKEIFICRRCYLMDNVMLTNVMNTRYITFSAGTSNVMTAFVTTMKFFIEINQL